jgi:hypothetical protein
MNKKVLLLAGAMSALFASKSTTTTPTALEIEPVTGAIDIRVAAEPTPAPAAPANVPVGTHQVAVRMREFGSTPFRQIIERPARRKVKYGKNRWVILG